MARYLSCPYNVLLIIIGAVCEGVVGQNTHNQAPPWPLRITRPGLVGDPTVSTHR